MPKRNTDFQFIETDAKTLESYLIQVYETITGATVFPASPERLFIDWVANVLIQERSLTNFVGNQNIPSRASGSNLDALAELFYASNRPEAKAAHCTVRFAISEAQESAVLIPAGTRVTDRSSTLYWSTQEDAYIDIGDTYADVYVLCQTAGVAGNGYEPGQINQVVDLPDYYITCENITTSDGGANAADDDTFYEILRTSMDAHSTAGPVGAYEYHAKAVSTEIADVAAVRLETVVENALDIYTLDGDKFAFLAGDTLDPTTLKVYPHGGTTEAVIEEDYTVDYAENLLTIGIVEGGALDEETQIDAVCGAINGGHVTIYVLMSDGTPAGTEIKNAVLEACSDETVRPLTDFVTMGDPITVPYNIDLTYYLNSEYGDSSTAIEAAVDDAVDEYIKWQCGKLGRDINPSYLIGLLMQTGIKRVVVREPAFAHLNDGSQNNVPQLASLGTKTVINGGREDE